MRPEQDSYAFIFAAFVIVSLAAFLSLSVTAITKSRKNVIEKFDNKKARETAVNLLDLSDEAVLLTEV
ncbi:MAG: hypothetical protein IKN43_05065, partial [Selenomonadaceae bacterium]|nr:hypothetical protein [Selenomonadaceae bacterium]